MNLIRNLLAVSFVLLIVACGQSPETTAANDASAPPPPPASAAASDAESSTSGAAPTVIVEESAADESDNNNVDDIVLAAANTGAAATAAAEPQKYLEGKHYSKLAAAQGTSSAPDVIEVAEVFWYGCPHCYSFDPFVTQWSGELEPGVEFVRLPVMWNPTNQIHARIFYTAEVLGKLEEMHEEVFKEMHVNKKMLTTESAIEDFFVRYGVSAEDFQKTFRSFAVESKLKRAKNLTQRYQIRSVPLLVVNGKYVTSGDGIRNFDDMLAVADELIALEQMER
jgi:thiol:disulfide interchange protein DsbA